LCLIDWNLLFIMPSCSCSNNIILMTTFYGFILNFKAEWADKSLEQELPFRIQFSIFQAPALCLALSLGTHWWYTAWFLASELIFCCRHLSTSEYPGIWGAWCTANPKKMLWRMLSWVRVPNLTSHNAVFASWFCNFLAALCWTGDCDQISVSTSEDRTALI
jgi:hypothetical protein